MMFFQVLVVLGIIVVAAFTSIVFIPWAWLLAWISSHWFEILLAAGAYVSVGIIYAIYRWFNFVKKCAHVYGEERAMALAKFSVPEESMSAVEHQKFLEIASMAARRRLNTLVIPPRMSDFSGNIIEWMAFWPLIIFWTACRGLLFDLWVTIYKRFGRVFQMITDRLFAPYLKDFK